MYLLKVESGNGYEYFQLPKHFKKENINYQNYFETHSKKIELVLSSSGKFTSNRYNIELIKESKETLYHCFLPDLRKDCIDTKNINSIPTFKVITYVEDEENPSPTRHIVFDGNAYLIKESGKTIEKF